MSDIARTMQQLAEYARENGLVITDPMGHSLSETQEERIGQDGSGFGVMNPEMTKTEPGPWWRRRRRRTYCAVIATVCRRDKDIHVARTAEHAEQVSAIIRHAESIGLDTGYIRIQRCLTHWWGPMPRR